MAVTRDGLATVLALLVLLAVAAAVLIIAWPSGL